MKDLSNLVPKFFLTAGESMSAGNTQSDDAGISMTAPGSQPVNPDPSTPVKHDEPGLEVPTGKTKNTTGSKYSNSVTSTDSTWKKV